MDRRSVEEDFPPLELDVAEAERLGIELVHDLAALLDAGLHCVDVVERVEIPELRALPLAAYDRSRAGEGLHLLLTVVDVGNHRRARLGIPTGELHAEVDPPALHVWTRLDVVDLDALWLGREIDVSVDTRVRGAFLRKRARGIGRVERRDHRFGELCGREKRNLVFARREVAEGNLSAREEHLARLFAVNIYERDGGNPLKTDHDVAAAPRLRHLDAPCVPRGIDRLDRRARGVCSGLRVDCHAVARIGLAGRPFARDLEVVVHRRSLRSAVE